MLVIGFGHRARQGKSTAAQAMLEVCPLDCQVRLYAFGDALRMEVRQACCAMGGQSGLIDGMKESGLMPDWVHPEDPKPRSLLQWWGTDYRRAKDPDYWVKRLRKKLENDSPEVALVTDVRFPNEINAIHALGGFVVKCTRTCAPDVIVHPHASESALDYYKSWDYTIRADSIPEVRRQARAIFTEVQIAFP